MRNRPISYIDESSSSETRLSLDASPRVRLWLLFVAMTLPILVIAARVVYLQVFVSERYIAAWEAINESREAVSARTGRILTADGAVLAEDRARYDLTVHYRWLEEPVDPRWLRQRALALLPRTDRRNKQKIANAEQSILAQRNELWTNLDRLLNPESLPEVTASLTERRKKIQGRVERIRKSVEGRQSARIEEQLVRREQEDRQLRSQSPLKRFWGILVRETTTTPFRTETQPVIVREEEQYHSLQPNISLDLLLEIEGRPARYPGVQVSVHRQRTYPGRDLASHIVGLRKEITAEELAKVPDLANQGYSVGNSRGVTGIEKQYEETMRGTPGIRLVRRNRFGEIVSTQTLREPVDGNDVSLAIDGHLQRTAEHLLDQALIGTTEGPESELPDDGADVSLPVAGSLVAIDVHTGEVLAAASAPRHDAQQLLHPTQAEWQALISDERHPLFPRVTQTALPPGSVFKIITAVAALEARLITADESIECQGYLHRPDRNRCYIYRHQGVGHGTVDLTTALAESCNVYFYHLAQRLGPEPILRWAQEFGFGVVSGCDLPAEVTGHLPLSESQQLHGKGRWYPGQTLQLGIGQGSLTVTPLQVVRMMAAVANGGVLVHPQFVRQTEGSSDASSRETELNRVRIPGLSVETLTKIREGLRATVENEHGTAHPSLMIPNLTVAGKTGTAEVGGNLPDHAWFAGYVPADKPRVALVVVLEQGGSGGRVASPVARRFIEALLETGVIPPSSLSDGPIRQVSGETLP